ncbi:unnamed protein product [Acanthoscelides obtectus]|uniref:Uncharacterized protein n=1 Tax=Acanthoscelides obtectus TaxID=200917 RepID=A0A9P0KUZ6_ACAOB|nr:unnamed protein product [Acanthoscelides obtectus]CAK1669169.1 hypothetical protein AOBTE_LOCUS26846 [Acanthoscelides obtectus]
MFDQKIININQLRVCLSKSLQTGTGGIIVCFSGACAYMIIYKITNYIVGKWIVQKHGRLRLRLISYDEQAERRKGMSIA